ncbi:MAG TPA: DedA family protein [Candidatus Paceibacterota bacterium]
MPPRIDSRYAKVIISLLVFLLLVWGLSFLDEYTLNFLLGHILAYRYTMIFLVAFLAGLMLPLPVNVMLVAVGSLSGQYFNFHLAMVTAAVSNSIGDTGQYLFFRHFGHKILRDKYAEKYSFFVNLERFFGRNTNWSIFISRLIGAFGTIVNFLSGYTKVSAPHFILFDLIGNFAFAFIFLSIGYLVGDSWTGATDTIGYITWTLAVILMVYILRTILRKEKPASPQASASPLQAD